MKKQIGVFTAFVLVGYLLISLSFPGQYIADDLTHIVNASYLNNLPRLVDSITARGGEGWSYRPVLSLTYFAENEFGSTSPESRRIVNFVIHTLNLCLLLLLVRKSDRLLGILTGLGALFFFHPVAWHSVLYVSARSTALVTLFILLTIYFFPRGRAGLLASGLFAVLAALTKETGLLAIPLAVIVNFETIRENSQFNAKRILSLVAILLPFVCYGLWYRSGTFTFFVSPELRAKLASHDAVPYWLSQVEALWIYLKLAFLNPTLWQFYHSPLLLSPNQAATLLPAAAGIAFVITLIFLLCRKSIESMLFALAGLIAFVPELIYPRELIATEQRVYLPLALFSIAISISLRSFKGRWIWGVLIFILAFNIWATSERANEYRDYTAVLKRDVNTSNDFVAAATLAHRLFAVEKFDEAAPFAELALAQFKTQMPFSLWYHTQHDQMFVLSYLIKQKLFGLKEAGHFLSTCLNEQVDEAFCALAEGYYRLDSGDLDRAGAIVANLVESWPPAQPLKFRYLMKTNPAAGLEYGKSIEDSYRDDLFLQQTLRSADASNEGHSSR